MNRKLESKIAVVTGGSAGTGLGVAKRFAGEGGFEETLSGIFLQAALSL
jgi:NADP-dependent 3-hydroxy acid dehydrogenase YdfG